MFYGEAIEEYLKTCWSKILNFLTSIHVWLAPQASKVAVSDENVL
jgi:hypothetical protein